MTAARRVPWWGVVSSVAAPVLLIVGWTVGAALQPAGPPPYNALRQTVSALAAHGATDRWVMTLALFAVGLCDVITGLALRPAALAGRIALIVGGVGGMLVAANPEPAGGTSPQHAFFAAIGFVMLTLWPAAAIRRSGLIPWALHRPVALCAAGLTAALLGWFVIELLIGGPLIGLSERALGEFQAIWPLTVVMSCRLAALPATPIPAPVLEKNQEQQR
jgi:hypothetical membrane protein